MDKKKICIYLKDKTYKRLIECMETEESKLSEFVDTAINSYCDYIQLIKTKEKIKHALNINESINK